MEFAINCREANDSYQRSIFLVGVCFFMYHFMCESMYNVIYSLIMKGRTVWIGGDREGL